MSRHRIAPGTRVSLERIDPEDTGKHHKKHALKEIEKDAAQLAALQEVLYAEHQHAVLIVLQGMDTAGKDGTIKHVMSALNPSGCEVAPFKVPTDEEAAHDFLWRAHRWAPRRGHIAIFNRSHYEDVLVPFVHETVARAALRQRYSQINAFEHLLAQNNTTVLKFFLHISREEQRSRLQARIDDPTKQWKFSLGDLRERKLWDRYQRAYEALLTRCSSDHAPWYVIPANHKWYRDLMVAKTLVGAIKRLNCQYPQPELSPAQLKRIRL